MSARSRASLPVSIAPNPGAQAAAAGKVLVQSYLHRRQKVVAVNAPDVAARPGEDIFPLNVRAGHYQAVPLREKIRLQGLGRLKPPEQ